MIKILSHPLISELRRSVAKHNSNLGPVIISISELISIKCGNIKEIRAKQLKLSEVTDMIHGAHIFHRSVRDWNPKDSTNDIKRMQQDNVMSLLVGDYLLAQSSVDMSDLRVPRTVGLMARGLEDYTSGEFLKLQLIDRSNNINSNSHHHQESIRKDVERHAELTCGSLLSSSCLSAAILAGHPDISPKENSRSNLSDLAYAFGFHTGSAQRLVELLHCPETNSETDKMLAKSLDVRIYDQVIHNHLNKSVEILMDLPEGDKRKNLLAILDEIRRKI